MKRTGTTNFQLQQLMLELENKSLGSRFWKRVLTDLRKPSRQRRTVNVYKIDKYAREGETVLIPGKVLSVGDINKKVQVAAVNFSSAARQKIEQARGTALSIQQLIQQNPDGKKVRILG
ncbi:MAG TPA: 50S ribosomal protein L18e [Candidatus Nanoarchaeia archaeon]|nr:50S ribosomal protein L18e [Candidatus Nanoarchaeia archaeon]